MRKYGREGFFFCLTYVEPKHQSDYRNQAGANDFSAWFGYFENVGYLLHGLTLIILK